MRDFKVLIMGAGNAGKSSLIVRFVQDCFVHEYDPGYDDNWRKQCQIDDEVILFDINEIIDHEEYSAVRDLLMRNGQFFVVCQAYNNANTDELENLLTQLRRAKDFDDKEPLPVFIVACKCDLKEVMVQRSALIKIAAAHGCEGFYETSSRQDINVREMFCNMFRSWRNSTAKADVEKARKQMEKIKGINAILPWNWSKKAAWNEKLKKLEWTGASQRVGSATSQEIAMDIENFRFPAPNMTKDPVAFYKDIRQLIETEEGRRLGDVKVQAEDGGQVFVAHKIVLCLRSTYLRKVLLSHARGGESSVVKIEGIVETDVLSEVLYWMYSNELHNNAPEALLKHLPSTASLLCATELAGASQRVLKERGKNVRVAMESSAMIETEMKPALSGDLKEICDIEIVVDKHVFKLHHAIVWARCKWLQVLLADRWTKSLETKDKKEMKPPVEITSFSADVFATVVEFLYTGRAKVAEEIALEVLIAADLLNLPRLVHLTELRLQTVIDAGNAVPLYLAASHYGAKQLARTCEYWMAVNYKESERNEQWKEVGEAVKKTVQGEYQRLMAERERLRNVQKLMQNVPCMLAQNCPWIQ